MDNETITFEDRVYVNPEVSMSEQDAFMDKFRALQSQNQSQINRDTYNLGTPVSSNLGGLIGAEGRWNAQYQRPQVNAAIENLRQINLQQAVNTAMQNQQNAIGNRLNQAKRAYYRAQQEASARDRASAKSGSGGDTGQGKINVNELEQGKVSGSDTPIQSSVEGTTTIRTPSSIVGDNLSGKPIVGVYDKADTSSGGQPLYSTNENTQNAINSDYSFWDVNNPLGWFNWILGLPGSKQQVKK